MRACLFLLPFIALALLRPGLAEPIRLLGVVLAVFSTGLLGWIHLKSITNGIWNLSGGILLLFAILSLSLPIEDPLFADWLIPVLLCGALVLWVPAPTSALRLLGLFLYGAIQAGLFVAAFYGLSLFPAESLLSSIQEAFLMSPPDDPLAVPVTHAIAVPAYMPLTTLWTESLLVVVPVLYALLCLQSGRSLRVIVLGISIAATLAVLWLTGQASILILSAFPWIFFLLCPFPVSSLQISVAVVLGITAGVGVLGWMGWNPLFPMLDLGNEAWFWEARDTFPALLAFPYPVVLNTGASSILGGVLLIASLAMDVFRHIRERSWNDPLLPLAICLTAPLVLLNGNDLTQVLASPLFWCAWLLIRPVRSPEQETKEETAFPPLSIQAWKEWLSHPTGILLVVCMIYGLLFAGCITTMLGTWRIDAALNQVVVGGNEAERVEAVTDAYRSSIHRGDSAALYATVMIQGLVQRGQLPPLQDLQVLEVAINTASEHRIACVLAMKRLSEFYLLHAESQAALTVLANGANSFPQLAGIREMYADLLDTLGRRTEALNEYEACLRVSPTSLRLLQKKALTLRALNRIPEAESVERSLSVLNPSFRVE